MSIAEFAIERAYNTDRSSPVRWIASHVIRHWWLLPIVLVGAFGNAALAGVVPVIIGDAFDQMSGLAGSRPGAGVLDLVRDSAAADILWQAAGLIVLSQVVRAVLQLGRNFGTEILAQRFERDARDELYGSLLGKSMTFHGRQPVGDTMARATNDIREVNLMLNPGLNLVVGSANFLIIPVLFAPRYDWQLVATPLAFIVAYVWALRRYLRQLDPITREVRQAFGSMNTRLTEVIDGIEVVKGAAQEDRETRDFESVARTYRDWYVRQGEREARFLPLLLLGLAISAGFMHALALFQAGAIAIGDVVAYVGLLQLFGFPTFVSLFAYSQVSSGISSAKRILELVSRETELDENRAGHTAAIEGRIEFDHVDFGYGDELVLRDVSFSIEPGQTVALVGQTGSGKSTVAKLINRTYDVGGGAVRVDGVDVREWNLESLRRQISIIEQDPFLFSRTVAENIAFGRPDVGSDEIEAAAAAAQADGFIAEMDSGYESVIGERGVTLSGGQVQRLAIARALLTDPRILILDDATSAIDSATEERIQRAMWRAAQGRTTVLITHRLSQIRWADLIIVLRNGEVVDAGDHDTLFRRCESYRRIFARFESADAA